MALSDPEILSQLAQCVCNSNWHTQVFLSSWLESQLWVQQVCQNVWPSDGLIISCLKLLLMCPLINDWHQQLHQLCYYRNALTEHSPVHLQLAPNIQIRLDLFKPTVVTFW